MLRQCFEILCAQTKPRHRNFSQSGRHPPIIPFQILVYFCRIGPEGRGCLHAKLYFSKFFNHINHFTIPYVWTIFLKSRFPRTNTFPFHMTILLNHQFHHFGAITPHAIVHAGGLPKWFRIVPFFHCLLGQIVGSTLCNGHPPNLG